MLAGTSFEMDSFSSLKLSVMVVHVGQMLGADEHEASRRMKSEIFTQVGPCARYSLHARAVGSFHGRSWCLISLRLLELSLDWM